MHGSSSLVGWMYVAWHFSWNSNVKFNLPGIVPISSLDKQIGLTEHKEVTVVVCTGSLHLVPNHPEVKKRGWQKLMSVGCVLERGEITLCAWGCYAVPLKLCVWFRALCIFLLQGLFWVHVVFTVSWFRQLHFSLITLELVFWLLGDSEPCICERAENKGVRIYLMTSK